MSSRSDRLAYCVLMVALSLVLFLGSLYALLWEFQWHRLLLALAALLAIVLALRMEEE